MPGLSPSTESGTLSVSTAGDSRQSLILFPTFTLKLSLSNNVFKTQNVVVLAKRMHKGRLLGDTLPLKGFILMWKAE